jgi:hypothetical protein
MIPQQVGIIFSWLQHTTTNADVTTEILKIFFNFSFCYFNEFFAVFHHFFFLFRFGVYYNWTLGKKFIYPEVPAYLRKTQYQRYLRHRCPAGEAGMDLYDHYSICCSGSGLN